MRSNPSSGLPIAQSLSDVESSLPVAVTLSGRRRERCRQVKRHAPIIAATVLLVVGCAVLAIIASRALVPSYGPRCTEDMACWQPALMGNGRGHVSPFVFTVDR